MIHEVLKSYDLIVDNSSVSFKDLLDDVDLPTAIGMLVTNIKRQNVIVFELEQKLCANAL